MRSTGRIVLVCLKHKLATIEKQSPHFGVTHKPLGNLKGNLLLRSEQTWSLEKPRLVLMRTTALTFESYATDGARSISISSTLSDFNTSSRLCCVTSRPSISISGLPRPGTLTPPLPSGIRPGTYSSMSFTLPISLSTEFFTSTVVLLPLVRTVGRRPFTTASASCSARGCSVNCPNCISVWRPYTAANYTAYLPITASKRRGDMNVARMTGVNIPSQVVPTGHGLHKWRPYVRRRKLHRIFTNNRLKT